MKPKRKYSKKKSFNPLSNCAPPLETLQQNSIKTRKNRLGSSANIILAFNMFFLIISLVYIVCYLLDISEFLIQCETHCLITCLNLLCCLHYIWASSYLIIAIKTAQLNYYQKYNNMLIFVCFLQLVKAGIYFIFREIIEENSCIFDFVHYEGAITGCGVFVGFAFLFIYFIRKLRIYAQGSLSLTLNL